MSERLQKHLFGLRVLLCLTRFSVPLHLKPQFVLRGRGRDRKARDTGDPEKKQVSLPL
jgi:hypothetical protein